MTEANNITIEEWRPVVGYETYYEISSLGRVRSIRKCTSSFVGKILKPDIIKGYARANLFKANKGRRFFVHVLVAPAFIGPCPAGKEINHIDAIPPNNTPNNLEYVTHKENQEHAVKLGRYPTGDRNGSRKYPERLKRGNEHPSRLHPERLRRGENHHFRLRPELIARGDKHWAKRMPERIPQGERCVAAKLTETQVLDIRKQYAEGCISQRKLALRFGVSQRLILFIVHRKIWKHI